VSIRRARLPFEGQYVQIPNAWMRDNRISHRARGILAEIMTHSEDWIITLGSLWKNSPEGREAVRKALLELVEAGYLARDQDRGELGRFGEINYVLTAPELSTATVFQKLEHGSITGVRSTAPQESTPKKTISKNTIEEKGAEAPDPLQPPLRTCTRHPINSDAPCRDCKADRVAQIAWEQAIVAGSRSDVWQPTRKPVKHMPGLCDAHRQPEATCEMCIREARDTIQAQFGGTA
jgi:hypothetical protein